VTKQNLRKSFLALALVLIASTASTAFAQINPTGGTGNLVAIHLR
jgi:hypothetical protein